ncbi:MAG: ATP-binding protein [Betaproteobacteria bacterium]|nr:ATP-binding protein [Betaproteobacteria bacterium]
MLLEFRVKNYRSLRDEQVLSLFASKDKDLAESHLASTGVKSLEKLVRTAVIYGPNASGKSNLLQAMAFMRAVIAESATVVQLGQSYNVQAFRLDEKLARQPTEFEITFIEAGVRYQYGFSLTPERIVDEWLLVYRASKPQKWFSRHFNARSKTHSYEFSTHLTGSRRLWQESTRPNALFLSTGVQLNSELLRPVFSWIVEKTIHLGSGLSPLPDYTTELIKSPAGRATVREFLVSADISISDIEAVSHKGISQKFQLNLAGGPAQVSQVEQEMFIPQFVHETKNGSARFELHEESLGTQRLYALAAPVLDVLKNGRVLVVDELDSSLHTLLVRRLVAMFHDNTLNTNGAQLVFTTHDTSLLENTLFRRDQVWFTEKDRNQATRLFPLTDFSPRKKEALERGYLSGRYGALPFFNDPLPTHKAGKPVR